MTEQRMHGLESDSVLRALDVPAVVLAGSGEITASNEAAQALHDGAGQAPVEVSTLFEPIDGRTLETAIETALDDGAATVPVRAGSGSEADRYALALDRLSTADGGPALLGIARETAGDASVSQAGLDMAGRERVLREMYEIIADRDRPFKEQVEALLALGRTELDAEYGTLSEIRGEDYVFEIVDTDDPDIEAGDVVPVSATNCEVAVCREQTLVLGDVARDAPEETDREGFTEWGIACYIGTPVYVEDDVYGTFCFYDTTPRAGQFSDWEVTLVDLMGRWVSYELERRATTDRLRRQNETLQSFASVVSHDLRNPLNVLDARLELAAETGDSEHFETARSAVERMDQLIDDLLSLARAGEAIETRTPVDLETALQHCWTTVATGEATLSIETARTVQADESRLRQLLENLLRNAVEHGGESVDITVGDLERGFYVADDGPGIPPDEREAVLEMGYSTAQEGTGFGLGIVSEIADAHGWSVSIAESEAGGAKFEIVGEGA